MGALLLFIRSSFGRKPCLLARTLLLSALNSTVPVSVPTLTSIQTFTSITTTSTMISSTNLPATSPTATTQAGSRLFRRLVNN